MFVFGVLNCYSHAVACEITKLVIAQRHDIIDYAFVYTSVLDELLC